MKTIQNASIPDWTPVTQASTGSTLPFEIFSKGTSVGTYSFDAAEVVAAQHMGGRSSQEDRYLAVDLPFDRSLTQAQVKQIIEETFCELAQEIHIKQENKELFINSGTTCSAVLMCGNYFVTIQLGDSCIFATVLDENKVQKCKPLAKLHHFYNTQEAVRVLHDTLSDMHIPEDKQAQFMQDVIRSASSATKITEFFDANPSLSANAQTAFKTALYSSHYKQICYLNAEGYLSALSPTRTFGNVSTHKAHAGHSYIPEVEFYEMPKDETCIINLSSDGITDTQTPQSIANQFACFPDMIDCAKNILYMAHLNDKKDCDNITLMSIKPTDSTNKKNEQALFCAVLDGHSYGYDASSEHVVDYVKTQLPIKLKEKLQPKSSATAHPSHIKWDVLAQALGAIHEAHTITFKK